MHLPLISFLTELWHLLDVSAVAGHGAVLAALLFLSSKPLSKWSYILLDDTDLAWVLNFAPFPCIEIEIQAFIILSLGISMYFLTAQGI